MMADQSATLNFISTFKITSSVQPSIQLLYWACNNLSHTMNFTGKIIIMTVYFLSGYLVPPPTGYRYSTLL